jgi:hypothetical protein
MATREEERQEALTEAARTLDKVGEAIGKLRAGLNVDINPLAMQLFMAYANGRSLQALALGGACYGGELLELASDPTGGVPLPPVEEPVNGSGLFLPGQG